MRIFVIFIVSLLFKIFYRCKTFGIEHLDQSKGTIIAPNHTSFLDPPIIGCCCPHEVHFLARESLFRFPGFGWLIRKLNTHPVSKGSGNLGTIKMACEFLEQNKTIVVFPEGRRSQSGDLQEGQSGIGLLVMKTHCQVVPAYIHGAYEIWSVHRKLPKLSGRLICVFGSPLVFNFESEDRKQMQAAITQDVMAAIANLKKWYLNGAKGTPP